MMAGDQSKVTGPTIRNSILSPSLFLSAVGPQLHHLTSFQPSAPVPFLTLSGVLIGCVRGVALQGAALLPTPAPPLFLVFAFYFDFFLFY